MLYRLELRLQNHHRADHHAAEHNWRVPTVRFPPSKRGVNSTRILVCAYLAVYNFSQVHPGDNVFSSNIAGWGTALFSLSLATNIIVTTLIGARPWRVNISVLWLTCLGEC